MDHLTTPARPLNPNLNPIGTNTLKPHPSPQTVLSNCGDQPKAAPLCKNVLVFLLG